MFPRVNVNTGFIKLVNIQYLARNAQKTCKTNLFKSQP